MQKITLSALTILAAASFSSPASAQSDVCRPTAPERPAGHEDTNPGIGSALGLQDEEDGGLQPYFGRLLTEYFIIDLAQNGEPGSASFLSYSAGNDCARGEPDDE